MLEFLATILATKRGRIIAASLIVIAVFALAIRSWTNSVYESGLEQGKRQAWTAMEKVNQNAWNETNRVLAEQKKAAAEQIAAVTKEHEVFTQRQRRTVDAVSQHKTDNAAAHAEIRDAVESALPITPEPVKQELAIFEAEVVELRADVADLTRLLSESNELFEKADKAHIAEVTALHAELAQITEQRDFYKTAFHESAPKPKKRSLFKKILIGVGVVATIGLISR
jgi:hypothetical protein